MNLHSNSVQYFRKLVDVPAKVLISAHYNPDGDTIGASLGLYHILKSMGHTVNVLVPNELPSFLTWMPGADDLIIYQSDPEIGNSLIAEAELLFCVDFNATSRVKFYGDQLAASAATKILIDHHLEPANEFDLSVSVIEVSSTSELLYQLIQEAGLESFINPEIAECLFVGIMTDTGSFSYACSRPLTFQITSRLIEQGIDIEAIHRRVYDTYSESRMRLLGYCLIERMKVLPELRTAYIWLSKDDLKRFDYQPGDTEGVVNYALSIQGITIAALFTERDDRIRISLRSKGEFSVNELARKYFKGGGHRNAAGGDSFESMDATLNRFEMILKENCAPLLPTL